MMAQLIEGDARGLHRGLIGNTPGLPPRFPTLPNRGVPPSDFNTVFQGIHGSSRSLGRHYQQHKGTPSYSVVVQDQPLQYANLVEQSEVSVKKSLHRRSASDLGTYLEGNGSLSMLSNIAEEVDSECQISQMPEKVGNDAKEDGDQLTDLLEEILQLHDQQNLPISTRSQALHPNLDSSIVRKTGSARDALEAAPGHPIAECEGMVLNDYYTQESNNSDLMYLTEQPENDLDPKKAKRGLANRQSAQRSRVRKLQYIAELERNVGTLQMEISSLSLQVIYLKHQRALLNMDNNALKQQVVFFVQEKRNKDSQNEMLKHDIRRLQKLSEFQSIRKSLQMQKQQQQPQQHHIQRHSSLPTDFIAKTRQPGGLNNGASTTTGFSSADGLSGLVRDFGGISLDTALGRVLCSNMDCIGTGEGPTMEPETAIVRQSSGGEIVADDT
ncbi:hypothetical protein GOP47_0020441 [Adiantum capillus-veneris]|uniref:BZIP domain-containing protein n=1 Tax=Adiantum capillus-veneris TaxID=13818 RepID=A0A9D4UEI8_ADICA|nr:hypothetical protein GOP47_0020441 [Adiantum capillus-veneris]